MLAASYVQTRFDQFSLVEVKLAFDEQTSLRAGAGLRVGGDAESVRFWMTGRYWNEFEGENTLLVDNDADDLTLADDFSGGFGELSGGASTTFTGGIVLFLNGGVKFADDYRAVNGSVGLSYRW